MKKWVFVLIMALLSSNVQAISPGWSEPIQITTFDYNDWMPALVQDSSGRYWIFYTSLDLSTVKYAIYMKNSTDGVNWSERTVIISNATLDDLQTPDVIIDQNNIFWLALWAQLPADDIFVSNSSDGVSWFLLLSLL
jgi:beta-xylosidase